MNADAPAPGTVGARPRLAVLLLAACLPALAALVYWPGLGGGFVFDDYPNIVDNRSLHVTTLAWRDWMAAIFSSPSSELQRPLSMLSFAANHYFTGLDPYWMKATTVLLHGLNSLLVFALVASIAAAAAPDAARRRVLGFGWLVALLWVVHPINLMAVLYVVQRMEVLSHSFVFLGLWLYASGRQRQLAGSNGWLRVLALAPCTALGMMAKESACLLPLYAFLLEWCLFRFEGPVPGDGRKLRWLFVVVLVLPALLGLAWLVPRALSADAFASRSFDLGERLLTEPRVVLDYLRWSVLPDLGELSLYHDDYVISRGWLSPPSTIHAMIGIAALLASAILARLRRPMFALGLSWFLCAQLLTASIIPLELVFEHRNYFASLGVCLALVDLLSWLAERSRMERPAVVAGGLIAILFAGLTLVRAREWSSPLHFAVSEASKHPQSPRATYELARSLIVLGEYRLESPFTQAAFAATDRARQVRGSSVLPDQAALILAARTGKSIDAQAWDRIYAKLRARPIGPQEYNALGALTRCAIVGDCRFTPDAMLGLFGAALSHGDNPEVLNIYADYAANALHDPALALRLWQGAIALHPRQAQYRVNEVSMLIALGRFDAAAARIQQLRELGRFGQNQAAADALEARLRAAAADRTPPSVR